ncbi:MAG TPA: TA system VapC family ribonuclease toxin [Acidobacteriota bacterium]|nr:TA system VapC family ribonuclease toxin [Acidobacteriota bacterium]
MIAVDTNILVYAHRQDSPWHKQAAEVVRRLAQSPDAWAIPWSVLHEFLAIVTHPRIYRPPTPLPAAVDQVSAWLESPSLVLLTESPAYWRHLQHTLEQGQVSGPRVHDARIAALCADHQVDQLWTFDRDFSRFPTLTPHNPLINT